MTILETIQQSFMDQLQNILWALFIIILGIILGKITGYLVNHILKNFRIDQRVTGEKKPKVKISEILGSASSWVIYLIALYEATKRLGSEIAADFVQKVLLFIPNLIGALLIILGGYGFALYCKNKIEESKAEYSGIVSKIIFFLVIYLAFTIALPLAHIDTSLLIYILIIIIASFGLGTALAIGLGLRDVVAEWARERYLKKKK